MDTAREASESHFICSVRPETPAPAPRWPGEGRPAAQPALCVLRRLRGGGLRGPLGAAADAAVGGRPAPRPPAGVGDGRGQTLPRPGAGGWGEVMARGGGVSFFFEFENRNGNVGVGLAADDKTEGMVWWQPFQ